MSDTSFFPRITMCSPFFRPSTVLCLLLIMVWGVPAGASELDAEISGMHITVIQPWYLYTHGTATGPERLFFSLMQQFPDGGADIVGEGMACEFPTADTMLPDREALKRMSGEALQKQLHHFQSIAGEYDLTCSAPPALVEINGFTAIACSWKKAGNERVPEPSHTFVYYFPLGGRLVLLRAYVYGDDTGATLLKRICASFIPQAAGPTGATTAATNSLRANGMSVHFPHTWDTGMIGSTRDDRLWAEAAKYDADDKRIVNVAVLSPIKVNSRQDPANLEQRLRASFSVLGTRAEFENPKILRTVPTEVNGRAATLTVVAGRLEGKDITVELRDIVGNGQEITIATRYDLSLPNDIRAELEAVYASFEPGFDADVPKKAQ